MSILIRGMEMPTSCGLCPLRHEARDGDECYLGASLTEYQKRPDDCPLVPIPPHGRLVDADALVRELNSIRASFGSANGLVEGGMNIAVSTVNGRSTTIPSEEGE